MEWLRKSAGVWLWLMAMAICAATGTGGAAQAPATDHEAKILRCRENSDSLLWLNREQIRERCGLWTKSYTVKTAKGEVERLVYSRYFVVTMRNGQASDVRQRRQIFTGFKKKD